MKIPTFRGEKYLDGGLTNQLPVLDGNLGLQHVWGDHPEGLVGCIGELVLAGAELVARSHSHIVEAGVQPGGEHVDRRHPLPVLVRLRGDELGPVDKHLVPESG